MFRPTQIRKFRVCLRGPLLAGLASAGALVLSAAATAPSPQQPRAETNASGLHRCIGTDGAAIFTDRACRDLEASDAPPPAVDRVRPGVLVSVRSCARNQDDLLYGVRNALEAHDGNRLAEYYHWTGMGNTEGYRLINRLANFSERPLLDVQLVSSAEVGTPMPPLPPPPPLGDDYPADDEYSVDDGSSDNAESSMGWQRAQPASPPRHNADLLRVDQMRSETDYESQVTYFRLRSNAGCWWLQF